MSRTAMIVKCRWIAMPTRKLPRVLHVGSKGRDVHALQRGLWRAGYRKPGPGGIITTPEFGDATREQLAKFQYEHGILATGKLGQPTFDKLLPWYDATALKLVDAVQATINKPVQTKRQQVVEAAWLGYNMRDNISYTQGSSRWSGITLKKYPPRYPNWADCSSFTTWCYWAYFGDGWDFVNGAFWKAGYTGTQINHGKLVAYTKARPGDLVFYGDSMWNIHHVAMYVGNGMVVSHGSNPGPSYRSIDYRPDRQQIRCYIDD